VVHEPIPEPGSDAEHASVAAELLSPTNLSFYGSFIVHLILLLSLSGVMSPGLARATRPLSLRMLMADEDRADVALETLEDVIIANVELPGSVDPLVSTPDFAAAGEPIDAVEPDGAALVDANVLPASFETFAPVGVQDLLREVGPPAASSGARGRSLAGAGVDGGEAITFFGVRATGSTVVYVVDCSSSMHGPPLDRLKKELFASIYELPESSKFAVVFFNSTVIVMDGQPRLVDASVAHKERALAWIDSIPASGGTDPSDALAIALRLKPAVIYLMTDGQFPFPFQPPLMQRLGDDGGSRATVNTVAFGQQAAAGPLQWIANATGGTHAFVDVGPFMGLRPRR